MTKREKHEIAVVTGLFVKDSCDEIRRPYLEINGTLKGIRNYIRHELVEFWSNGDPYLEKEYLDYEWLRLGNRIINIDDAWCWIRDGLKFDLEHSGKAA